MTWASAIDDFLSTQNFQPHGFCLLWQADIFWLHVVADAVIALSYFSIPAALAYFAIKRSDLVYRWVPYLFGIFIVACGVTHLFGIWTMWVPAYGAEGLAKGFTAIVSLATAIALWFILPRLIALPSNQQLAEKNDELAREVEVRKAAQKELDDLNRDLEQRVAERTRALEAALEELQGEMAQRRKVEQDLKASRSIAERANQAKSVFLASMSHELRTPLNGIVGYAQILDMNRRPGDEESAGWIADILSSGRHLEGLIADLLDLACIESGDFKVSLASVNAATLFEEVRSAVEPKALDRKIKLAIDREAARGISVWADELRLRQVLINLCSNGIKYNGPGGVVALSVAATPAGEVVFKVADSGWGIPRSRQGELFEPFNRLGRDALGIEGTGVGLTLSRRFVELMNGRLEWRSEEGKGSEFSVCLSSADQQRAGASQARRTAAALEQWRGPPVSVLCIEDNPANQRLMRDFFAQFPACRFTIAESGEKGVELALELRPEVVLVDLQLPGIDGFEVLQRLRALLPEGGPQAFAVSALAADHTRRQVMSAGFDDYFTKPVDFVRLLGRVTEAMVARKQGTGAPGRDFGTAS